MSGRNLFKLIVKNRGQPSINGLKYVYKNIDIINEMGIEIKITIVDSDMLDKETVGEFNARGITSFPAMISDNGKVMNGIEQIKNIFERNKKNYSDWVAQNNQVNTHNQRNDRQMPQERGPDYSFGNAEEGFSGPDMRNFYDREMNLDAFKRDQKNNKENSMDGGMDGEDFNRRIADFSTKIKIPQRKKPNAFDSGGGDVDDDFDIPQRRTTARNGALDEPVNNIVPRGDDLFENRFMEGVDDKNYVES